MRAPKIGAFEKKNMNLLAVNAGSTSIKLALYHTDLRRQWGASVAGIGTGAARLRVSQPGAAGAARDLGPLPFAAALDLLLRTTLQRWPQLELAAVGHRVVHGGEAEADAAALDETTLSRIARWTPFAPLHQPLNLAAINAARQAFPQATHVACFDTAFHRCLPRQASLTALPASLRAMGLRRFGFHGLSFDSVLHQLEQQGLPVRSERIVLAHLGGGSSLCAVAHGRSVETTMGVTPLSGVPMTTRCGDLDPGAVLFLLQSGQVDARRLQEIFYQESGLKAVGGMAGDMRQLLQAAGSSADAREAVDFYCYQVRKHIGALAAAMGGVDRIAFTGGIGANAPAIRWAVCQGLQHLGVQLATVDNDAGATVVSSPASRIPVHTLQTDEEAVIARLVATHIRAQPFEEYSGNSPGQEQG